MHHLDRTAHVALGEAAQAMRNRRATDDRQLQAMHAFRRRQEEARRGRSFLLRIVGMEAALVAVLHFVR